jgi:hypothetical protein
MQLRDVRYEIVLLGRGEFAVDVPVGGRDEERVRMSVGSIEDCTAWIVLHERGLR